MIKGVTILVGTTGTGKSTFSARMLAENVNRNGVMPDTPLTKNGQPVGGLVVDPHGTYPYPVAPGVLKKLRALNTLAPAPTGSRIITGWELTQRIVEHPGYIVVIDDVRMLVEDNEGKPLKTLCVRHRHLPIRLVMIYHSIRDVHPGIWRFAHEAYIFRIKESLEDMNNRLPNNIGISEKDYTKIISQGTGEAFRLELN